MITTVVMPVVRHLATGFAGYLVTSGLVDAAMQETVAGVILGAVAVGFSIYEKQVAKKALVAAKAGS